MYEMPQQTTLACPGFADDDHFEQVIYADEISGARSTLTRLEKRVPYASTSSVSMLSGTRRGMVRGKEEKMVIMEGDVDARC